MKQIKNNNALGKDGVITKILKLSGRRIHQRLRVLFNRCLMEGQIREKWKDGKIVLTYKIDDKESIRKYERGKMLK